MRYVRWKCFAGRISITHNRRRERGTIIKRFGARPNGERERERKGVTFFDMGIYFRPISGIPRRKYPPRSSADCITRRGMRRTEIEERKKKLKVCACVKKRRGTKEKEAAERKGEVGSEREKEERSERRHVGTRHPSARDVCLLLLCLLSNDARPWRMRESIMFIAAPPILVFDGRTPSIRRTQRSDWSRRSSPAHCFSFRRSHTDFCHARD